MTFMKPLQIALRMSPASGTASVRRPARERTRLMDALRGLLASWVVLHHIVLASGFDQTVYPWRLFAHHGQEPVLVFFILSGFAITKSLGARPQRWSSFLIARFWRIYPVYVVALAIGVGAWWSADDRGSALLVDLDRLRIAAWAPDEGTPRALHFLLHLFQVHGVVPSAWLPHVDTSLVAPAWSLSTEFQFYVIAPLLCLILLRDQRGNTLVLALVLTIAVIWPNFIDVPAVSPANVLRYMDLFVLGMIGAVTLSSGLLGRLGYTLAAITVAAASLHTGRVIVATAVFVWLLFWWPSTLAAVERLLDTKAGRLCLFVGALSFPLYIIHYPLARLLLIATTELVPGNRAVFLVVWALATVALSYVGAALLHRYVEVPGTRYGKRIAERRESRLRSAGQGYAHGLRQLAEAGLAGADNADVSAPTGPSRASPRRLHSSYRTVI
jgi:peptidoglycan/LPS O-acetylase OafA/YrhL